MNEKVKKIRFPEDRPAGQLMLMNETSRETKPARGTIEVEQGTQVVLTVSQGQEESDHLEGFIPGDLSGLKELSPDDLYALSVSDVEDASLENIAHLSGIKQLSLAGKFTDEGLRYIEGLTGLVVLNVSSNEVRGSGFKYVKGMSELRMVNIQCPSLEPEGVANFAELTSLDYFVISTKTFTSELARALPSQPSVSNLTIFAEKLDKEALVKTAAKFPSLQSFSFYDSEPQEVYGNRDLFLELLQTYPKLTINRTWYAKEALLKIAEGNVKDIDTRSRDESVTPIDLNVAEFDETIAGEKPVLVDFWAEWCGPWKAIAPTIRDLASDLAGQVIVGKVDTDANKELMERYEIKGIPHLMLFKRGNPLAVIGSQSREGILAELAPALS